MFPWRTRLEMALSRLKGKPVGWLQQVPNGPLCLQTEDITSSFKVHLSCHYVLEQKTLTELYLTDV